MAAESVKIVDSHFMDGKLNPYPLRQWIGSNMDEQDDLDENLEKLHNDLKKLVQNIEKSSISNRDEWTQWVDNTLGLLVSQLDYLEGWNSKADPEPSQDTIA